MLTQPECINMKSVVIGFISILKLKIQELDPKEAASKNDKVQMS